MAHRDDPRLRYNKDCERLDLVTGDDPTSDTDGPGTLWMTPTSSTCGEIMDPGTKACSVCGTVFTPDAKSVEDNIDADVKQSYAETDPDDSDQQDKISQLDDLLEDPEVKQALLEKIGDK